MSKTMSMPWSRYPEHNFRRCHPGNRFQQRSDQDSGRLRHSGSRITLIGQFAMIRPFCERGQLYHQNPVKAKLVSRAEDWRMVVLREGRHPKAGARPGRPRSQG